MAHTQGSGDGTRIPASDLGPGLDHGRGAPNQLTESTARLVAELQLHLDLLRKTRDPHLSEIARQLEQQLAAIRREIGRAGEQNAD